MTDPTPLPPGWYPDVNDPAIERYWSGHEWDPETAPRPIRPPRASRRLNAYLLAVLVLAVAGVVVAIVATRGDDGSRSSCNAACQARIDRENESYLASLSTRHVLIELTGDVDSADITYSVGSSGIEQQGGVDVPLTRKTGEAGIEFTAEPGDPIVFSAQISTESGSGYGSLTCRVTVDGRVIAEHTSSGDYAVVSCDGTA